MLFSPKSMEYFQTRYIKPGPNSSEQPYFQLRGSVATVMGQILSIQNDGSRAGRAAKNHRDSSDIAEWCGFRGQTLENAFKTGSITAAIEDFQKAQAGMTAQLTRGKIEYSPVGGSFNTGRFLTGHPICMYNRQKTKLPPKTIELVIRCSASLKPSALSGPLTRIIRAAWEYQTAGGLVTLRVNYFHTFSEAQAWNGINHKGMITTLDIPLANPGLLASAASIQFYRGISMPLACYLSGEFGDGLPIADWTGPGLFTLSGIKGQDDLVLEALRIA
jgi:hypothetical protein